MSDLIDRIIRSLPAVFFQRLAEETDASFAEALLLTQRHADEPEKANILGQLRHARCEDAFRRVARENGLTVMAPHTEPAGGRYSLVVGGDVVLIRSNIQRHCGPPRTTAFREHWAALNSWLDPVQLDILREAMPLPADRICAMVVTSSHPRRGDPSVPAFLGLGVPTASLGSWAMLASIPELLAHYHDADARSKAPKVKPIEVKDKAVPRLRKRPDQAG